jgi:hypothetical protein
MIASLDRSNLRSHEALAKRDKVCPGQQLLITQVVSAACVQLNMLRSIVVTGR